MGATREHTRFIPQTIKNGIDDIVNHSYLYFLLNQKTQMNSQPKSLLESSLSDFACKMAEMLFDSQATNIRREIEENRKLLSMGIVKRLPAEICLLHAGVIVRTIVLHQCAFNVSQFLPEDVAMSASMGVAAAFGVSIFFRYFTEDEISTRLFDYMGGKMPDASDNERFAHLFSRFVVGKEPFWWLERPPIKQKETLLILNKIALRTHRKASAFVIKKSSEFTIIEANYLG